ncbi:MAG: sigma factor-like helix-turn-helix DNA-binding protein [Polyangiaceae bacterium]|jgi:RNA polymerase sigma-70 factor (ECF subfamily)
MTDAKASPPGDVDLAAVVREARARWPGIAADEEVLRRHLEVVGRRSPPYPVDAFLAAASAAGDAAALRAVEGEIVARIPEMVRRVDPSAAFGGEIGQQVRVRLFVREGADPPRIARYTGEVPLAAWVRVIALRLAFNAKRGKTGSDAGGAAAEGVALDDPEVEYLRGQYREPFARAFEAALAALPKEDRTILRLHYVDGANIDAIGLIFQVHRATIARRLVRIRADVLERARALLAERLGAELDEAASLMGSLAAEVDVTLSRVLGAVSA